MGKSQRYRPSARARREPRKPREVTNEKKVIAEFQQNIVDQEAKTAQETNILQVDQNDHPTELKQLVSSTKRASEVFCPQISCVFAFLHLRIPLDLVHIVTRIRGAEYNPKRFHAVVLRIREPKATAVMYASGKLVCMGAKNEQAARTACRKFVRILQKVGYQEAKFAPTEAEPLIRNVMAKCKVPFPIRLEDLARAHNDFVSFEPEIFPGLIYRMASPRVTIFVFVTGTVLVVGAETREEVHSSFDAIYPVLYGFKKEVSVPSIHQSSTMGPESETANLLDKDNAQPIIPS